jgi:hypothetical protein
MSEWLPYLLTILISAGGAYAVFRIRFERFEAMDTRREQDWKDWREQLDQTLREREAASQRNAESLYRLGERMGAQEKRSDSLHDWKHKIGEAYLPRAVDDHHRRLERLERKVFNGQRGEDR